MRAYTLLEFNKIPIKNGRKRCEIGDYSQIKKFINCDFNDRMKFKTECVFVNCTFGDWCEFGDRCSFDLNCSGGMWNKVGDNCQFPVIKRNKLIIIVLFIITFLRGLNIFLTIFSLTVWNQIWAIGLATWILEGCKLHLISIPILSVMFLYFTYLDLTEENYNDKKYS